VRGGKADFLAGTGTADGETATRGLLGAELRDWLIARNRRERQGGV
jgi:hypothetical protein